MGCDSCSTTQLLSLKHVTLPYSGLISYFHTFAHLEYAS